MYFLGKHAACAQKAPRVRGVSTRRIIETRRARSSASSSHVKVLSTTECLYSYLTLPLGGEGGGLGVGRG